MKSESRTRHIVLAALSALTVIASPSALAASAAATPPTIGSVPTDRASYFDNADLQNIWKDLEARQVINKRVVEGGSYSINVRIVRPTEVPLIHAATADVWIVTAGTATAVTGGELLDAALRPNSADQAGTAIRGGTDQPLKPGDIVFVPPGVPHTFKDLNGFRAFLIRFDVPDGAVSQP
jgi:mannose-6-phosphate isomerase-like protein (cupin superfamily)